MSLKSRLLSTVRRGREVAWCPEWMNLGNLLYVGLWAYHEKGTRRVLLHEKHRAVLERIAPRLLSDLFLAREAVKFTDQRVTPWSSENRGEWFDDAHLPDYIEEMILDGSELLTPPADLKGALVVNARRGDYYSVEPHRQEFGMNQIEHVRDAVALSVGRNGAPDRFVIVSDDQEWCRLHLAPLLGRLAPVSLPDGDAVHDLATVVHAERLVLPNSTFSYWGGYIGDVLNPGREVLAPWFWSRSSNGGRAHQLRRHWTVVGDGLPAAIDE